MILVCAQMRTQHSEICHHHITFRRRQVEGQLLRLFFPNSKWPSTWIILDESIRKLVLHQLCPFALPRLRAFMLVWREKTPL